MGSRRRSGAATSELERTPFGRLSIGLGLSAGLPLRAGDYPVRHLSPAVRWEPSPTQSDESIETALRRA